MFLINSLTNNMNRSRIKISTSGETSMIRSYYDYTRKFSAFSSSGYVFTALTSLTLQNKVGFRLHKGNLAPDIAEDMEANILEIDELENSGYRLLQSHCN